MSDFIRKMNDEPPYPVPGNDPIRAAYDHAVADLVTAAKDADDMLCRASFGDLSKNEQKDLVAIGNRLRAALKAFKARP